MPLKVWERFVFWVGVFVAASFVLVPALGQGAVWLLERPCEEPESLHPLAPIAQAIECMNRDLGNAMLGELLGLVVAGLVAAVVIRWWGKHPPRRVVPWTITAAGPVAVVVIVIVVVSSV